MSRQLRIISDGIDKSVADGVKKVTLAVTAAVTEATPVDTGWARANWVPSLSPIVVKAGELSDQERRSRAGGQAAAQAAAVAAIAVSYNIGQGAVYISNGVEYIAKLNSGSSKQAPVNFVQKSIVAGVRSIRS